MMANRKKYWIAIPLVLAGSALFGYYQWNKAPGSLAQSEPNHILEAQQLLSEFQGNPSRSNEIYINKIIEVSGTCINIESKGDTAHYVYLGGQGNGDILCQLESPKGALPKKGDAIQCKGICTGYDDLTGGVLMNRCVLNNP